MPIQEQNEHPLVKEVLTLGDWDVSSNAILYPAESMMPWHTNSDCKGIRTYYTYSEKPSLFMWKNPNTNEIIINKDKAGWSLRCFLVKSTPPFLWHSVYAEGERFSFGFNRYRKR